MDDRNRQSLGRDERGQASVSYVVGVAGIFWLLVLGVVLVFDRVWFEPLRPVALAVFAAIVVAGVVWSVLVAIMEVRRWIGGRVNRRSRPDR